MGLFGSIQWNPIHMQFAPPPGVSPVDAGAFTTPQEKAAADKARRGDLLQQTLNSQSGTGNIQGPGGGGPMAPAAGGVPGDGGGAAPTDSANIQSIMGTLGMGGGPAAAGGTAGAAGGGGLMASIMKMLPMLMGG